MDSIKVNGRTFCATCYKQASEEVKSSKGDKETLGQLAYDFLHYEFNHLTDKETK